MVGVVPLHVRQANDVCELFVVADELAIIFYFNLFINISNILFISYLLLKT
jgi:hypothetical protein